MSHKRAPASGASTPGTQKPVAKPEPKRSKGDDGAASSTTTQANPSASDKQLFLVFERHRAAEFGEVTDRVDGRAFLATEEQRAEYIAYAQKKRDAAKMKAENVTRLHEEAMDRYIAMANENLKTDKAAQKDTGKACDKAPDATAESSGQGSAPAFASDENEHEDGEEDDDDDDGDDEDEDADAFDTDEGEDSEDNIFAAIDKADKEQEEVRSILGTPIGYVSGWIFYQDAPSMRGTERYYTFDCADSQTLAIAVELMGPGNSSRVPSCPDLANGGLLVIEELSVDKEHRGKGFGLRLCSELLRRFQTYWRRAIIWPAIVNTEEHEGLSTEERERIADRLRAAYGRIGFRPLGDTKYLMQDVPAFETAYTDFATTRDLSVTIAPSRCACVGGMSRRMREAFRVAAELQLDLAGTFLDFIDIDTLGDTLEPLAFFPPSVTLTKNNVKGFLQIAGAIGLMCKVGVPPAPKAVELCLEQSERSSSTSSHEVASQAPWRGFLRAGGSTLDPLDWFLDHVQRRIDIEAELPRALGGLRLKDDKTTQSWYDAHLPKCPEHDSDYEGLRHRWWASVGKPADVRGPYRGDGADKPAKENVDPSKSVDGVPAGLLYFYQQENGKVPRWAEELLGRSGPWHFTRRGEPW